MQGEQLKNKIKQILLLLVIFIHAEQVFSETPTTKITVQGEVYKKPDCSINNEKPLNVDFGNSVLEKNINGMNYQKQINLEITCTEDNFPGQLQITVSGESSDFNASALKTTLSGLGIQLQLDNSSLKINTPVEVEKPQGNILTATLIKQSDASLLMGEFEATATITAEYQ